MFVNKSDKNEVLYKTERILFSLMSLAKYATLQVFQIHTVVKKN